MNARSKIKALVALRCITLKQLAQMMSDATDKKYTYKSLIGKMERGTISLDEAYLIADLLNYRLEFIDNT